MGSTPGLSSTEAPAWWEREDSRPAPFPPLARSATILSRTSRPAVLHSDIQSDLLDHPWPERGEAYGTAIHVFNDRLNDLSAGHGHRVAVVDVHQLLSDVVSPRSVNRRRGRCMAETSWQSGRTPGRTQDGNRDARSSDADSPFWCLLFLHQEYRG